MGSVQELTMYLLGVVKQDMYLDGGQGKMADLAMKMKGLFRNHKYQNV